MNKFPMNLRFDWMNNVKFLMKEVKSQPLSVPLLGHNIDTHKYLKSLL